MTVPCGTTITTKSLNYNSAAVPSQPCSGIQPPAGTASVNIVKTVTTDPLAAKRFGRRRRSPTLPAWRPDRAVWSGGRSEQYNFTFSWGARWPARSGGDRGLLWRVRGSTWTVTCPAGGTYQFGSIQLGGGITLNFAVGGSATNIYDFNGAINVSGSARELWAWHIQRRWRHHHRRRHDHDIRGWRLTRSAPAPSRAPAHSTASATPARR